MEATMTKNATSKKTHDHDITARLALFAGIVFMITVALVFVLSKIQRFEEMPVEPETPAVTDQAPVEEEEETPEPIEEEEPEEVVIQEPIRERPAGMICDDLNFICVDDSVENSLLSSPFNVSGSGIAFENTINWRLLDGNGRELERGFVTANAPEIGEPGDFEIRAFILSVPETATGTLEVLEYSAKDGRPIHVGSIPVRLPRQTMSVKIFLPKTPVGMDCSAVQPFEIDVPRSILPIETSLRALLEAERFVSEHFIYVTDRYIPEGAQLVSLNVSGGTATAVFSPELENYGGGSCNVQAIRAQIETTLKQFASVRNVVIQVEGKTPEETLQP
jgi:hypothetical protein